MVGAYGSMVQLLAGEPRRNLSGSIIGWALSVVSGVLPLMITFLSRLSGYLLFPLLLLTAHLGGSWSDWAGVFIDKPTKIAAYSVAPVLILAAVYARARCVIYS